MTNPTLDEILRNTETQKDIYIEINGEGKSMKTKIKVYKGDAGCFRGGKNLKKIKFELYNESITWKATGIKVYKGDACIYEGELNSGVHISKGAMPIFNQYDLVLDNNF